jgi:pimeloyl-ACP methyl ester carboxylesterase
LSDCGGDVERCFSKADLIDNVMLYWATGTITSSMRYYWEEAQMPWVPSHGRKPIVEAPTGIIQWPGELMLMPQGWMERTYNLVDVVRPEVGGHFHPMEQPDRLVDEIRSFFRERR